MVKYPPPKNRNASLSYHSWNTSLHRLTCSTLFPVIPKVCSQLKTACGDTSHVITVGKFTSVKCKIFNINDLNKSSSKTYNKFM